MDEPVKKFMKIFPGVNEAIKHHDRMAQELEKAQQKFDKATGNDESKARSQRDVAEQRWKQVSDSLPNVRVCVRLLCVLLSVPLSLSLSRSVQSYSAIFVSVCASVLVSLSSLFNKRAQPRAHTLF